MRKTPRGFVLVDELWDADEEWKNYYIQQKVWVHVDEYRSELPGDEDYSRILIHSGADIGWQFSRGLNEKKTVLHTLEEINQPVSEQQLIDLGFIEWNTDELLTD